MSSGPDVGVQCENCFVSAEKEADEGGAETGSGRGEGALRPDHLEELLISMALQSGLTPERLMRAKERITEKLERVKESEQRKREPRKSWRHL